MRRYRITWLCGESLFTAFVFGLSIGEGIQNARANGRSEFSISDAGAIDE